MKRNQAVRLLATLAALVCLLAWVPGQAAAASPQHQTPATVSATDGSVDGTSSSPFSKKDLMALAAGATVLVAFGVGFRRISAPLE